jgi:hypothetical protein
LQDYCVNPYRFGYAPIRGSVKSHSNNYYHAELVETNRVNLRIRAFHYIAPLLVYP